MANIVLRKIHWTIAFAAVAVLAFAAGRAQGVQHAIEDAIVYTVECYDADNPYANARPDGTDQTIYIELDGNLYEHGMYQG